MHASASTVPERATSDHECGTVRPAPPRIKHGVITRVDLYQYAAGIVIDGRVECRPDGGDVTAPLTGFPERRWIARAVDGTPVCTEDGMDFAVILRTARNPLADQVCSKLKSSRHTESMRGRASTSTVVEFIRIAQNVTDIFASPAALASCLIYS